MKFHLKFHYHLTLRMATLPYEYEKYVTTSTSLKKTLEKYGVAIIPGVLNPKECKAMVDGMWNTLEHITKNFDETTPGPISRNNPDTWRSFYELFPLHSMLLQRWEIGHAQYIWNLRQNPKILKIWSEFWGVKAEEMLVSFDGCSIHLPPETTNKGWARPNKRWLHTDQSYTRNEFECVQSWVTANEVNEGDATLTVLEGSHAYHGEAAKKFGIVDKGNWNLLSDEQFDFYVKEKKCRQVCIRCPKGSIVFWDSRTIHSGREAEKTREKPNLRCIAYLCYTPRSFATEKALEKKKKYFEEKRMTSHWPHAIKVFAKSPRLFAQQKMPNVAELPMPVLRNVGKWLAGYVVEKQEYRLDEEGFVVVEFE